ncbi:MAG TPA: GspE/PulE family protein [Abditibacteriaceae bacterium]|jgi:type II secretory ATPase GspE/PulE/Tfp pilus assembly ATPase PilB-like protein
MTEQQLARNLVQAGLVTPQQVREAAARRAPGVGIAQALVDMGAVMAMEILEVAPEAFSIVSQGNAQSGALATAETGAMTNGAVNGTSSAATMALAREAIADLGPSPHQNIGLGADAAPILDDSGVIFEGERSNQTEDPVMGTIVTYCNELLKIAVAMRSSDMHLEPREDGLLPRYRVDGQLRAGGIIPKELQPPIISRFKVLANLDITENRMPQDGRFRATIGGRVFDFRVSSLPSIHGEKVVMRLLDRSSLVTDLTQLGFTAESHVLFKEMLGRSYGMILVTGPTGSGKTTTLYAALAATRDETKNVITVEDPVEYELPGVTQTNVQAEIDLTFATQLRAILRQDPDVILVGEIRDTETAEVAIRAALTGHLVLSTLHTNSAVGAVTRLQDMGVAPFLIASSLAGCLAQRLVRLICRHCRAEVPFNSTEYQEAAIRFKLAEGTKIYYGTGCEECGHTGYRGRMAVIELLTVDSDIRRAIMEKTDADSLRRLAQQNGLRTLWDDGMDKLTRGLTTADELSRVLLGAQDE